SQTTKPVVVLGNLAGAVDPDFAAQLRQHGIPVLEGLRPGLIALRHLLARANRSPATASSDEQANSTVPSAAATAADSTAMPATPAPAVPADAARADGSRARRDRGAALLAAGVTGGVPLLELLGEYGIATSAARQASDEQTALAAARSIGYPVVLKTAAPAITHKSDASGVLLDIRGPAELAAAYADLSARLDPEVLICESVPPGTELALGIARDPDRGPSRAPALGGRGRGRAGVGGGGGRGRPGGPPAGGGAGTRPGRASGSSSPPAWRPACGAGRLPISARSSGLSPACPSWLPTWAT